MLSSWGSCDSGTEKLEQRLAREKKWKSLNEIKLFFQRCEANYKMIWIFKAKLNFLWSSKDKIKMKRSEREKVVKQTLNFDVITQLSAYLLCQI